MSHNHYPTFTGAIPTDPPGYVGPIATLTLAAITFATGAGHAMQETAHMLVAIGTMCVGVATLGRLLFDVTVKVVVWRRMRDRGRKP